MVTKAAWEVLQPRVRYPSFRVPVAMALAVTLAMVTAVRATAPPFPGLRTTTITSPDTDLPIPDNAALTALVMASGVGGVVVDVDVSVNITHPQAAQLDIYLVSPKGTTVTLSTDNGGNNANVFAGTTFDDQASGTPSAPNVRNFVYTTGVATGPIQPEQALGALVGEAPDGPWVLVVSDDSGGQTGVLHSWSITISTLGAVGPSAPLAFPGAGGNIPDNNPAGRVSTVQVSGAGPYLYDLEVNVDITHPNAADIDMFLTAPSGKRIDLVTDVGGGNDDLYHGTTFDDHAPGPASDMTLPTNGTAFGRIAGEGALSAFLGDDPNGPWTLTVVDDAGGNTGMLRGWTLTVVTATVCGNGTVEAGEQCDDGNGLVDALDPACQPATLTLGTAALTPSRGLLRLTGTMPIPAAPGGPVTFALADGNGGVLCADLGALGGAGPGRWAAHGKAGAGSVALRAREDGTFTLTARRLDLSTLDDATVRVGLSLGTASFAGSGSFRARGARRIYP